PRQAPRRGISLIEAVMMIFMLSFCMFAGTLFIFTAVRSQKVAQLSLETVLSRMELAKELRHEVHRATALNRPVPGYTVGPECLTLTVPEGFVVYRLKSNHLERIAIEGKNEVRRDRLLPEGTTGIWQRTGSLIELKLTQQREYGEPRLLTIAAALPPQPGGAP
ncbi:MAG: PulJ/GspJ family protein, partial [Gemmataceae bacterium]